MLVEKYQKKVDAGELKYDAAQVNLLEILSKYLIPAGRFSIPFRKKAISGVYIYGSVGRGKTAMMDLFFANSIIKNKLRLHFNSLVNYINNLMIEGKNLQYDDPMIYVQKKHKKLGLMCIDEFEVLDIVTSVVMRRFLLYLLGRGCILIITSNTKPCDLYKNGLQRDKFLELIEVIEGNMHIFSLDHPLDYRKIHLNDPDYIKNHKIFEVLDEPENVQFLEENLLPRLLNLENSISMQGILRKEINVSGRVVNVPHINGIALLDFREFCLKNYAYNDYREICKHFDNILVYMVNKPKIEDGIDAWRRFIWLVDEIYEAKNTAYFTMLFDYQGHIDEKISEVLPQVHRCFSRLHEIDQL